MDRYMVDMKKNYLFLLFLTENIHPPSILSLVSI